MGLALHLIGHKKQKLYSDWLNDVAQRSQTNQKVLQIDYIFLKQNYFIVINGQK